MNITATEAVPNLHFGTVSAVDDETMRVRVRLPELDNLRTNWLFVGVRKTKLDKDYWLPDPGEHVVCLLDQQCENGVVLCAIYSDEDTVPVVSRNKWHKQFADGTTIEYDRASHALTVNCVGTVTVQAQGPVMVKAAVITLDAATVHCTGELHVATDLHVGSNIDAGGTVMDAGGNSNHHRH